ncbi:hypothetical protein [Sulfobacillus thermosulfidooxidans]|uniref:hypothetical protein n=1 Tax=Sulfobacillus thermosulfidooxidans TaxID=28034 RepID=UPI0002D46799|nr:hypothetical protein [Sulfobacillus thermosulfidooxidans]
MNIWSKRGLTSLGTVASLLGIHWAASAAPPPLSPASPSAGVYANAEVTTRQEDMALQSAVHQASQSDAEITASTASLQAELNQAQKTLAQLQGLESTDRTQLSAVKAAIQAAQTVSQPPVVHTVTGASGKPSDDNGGGDDSNGGTDD